MSLTVSDMLVIKYGTWMRFQVNNFYSKALIVPKEYFDEKEYNIAGLIQTVEGWCYRWYQSGTDYLTGNEWSCVFDTKQEAFEEAYAELNDGKDDGGCHDLEWLTFAKNNELNDKVVITSMNGYTLSEEVANKLAQGDY